jgi:hypothetical protein
MSNGSVVPGLIQPNLYVCVSVTTWPESSSGSLVHPITIAQRTFVVPPTPMEIDCTPVDCYTPPPSPVTPRLSYVFNRPTPIETGGFRVSNEATEVESPPDLSDLPPLPYANPFDYSQFDSYECDCAFDSDRYCPIHGSDVSFGYDQTHNQAIVYEDNASPNFVENQPSEVTATYSIFSSPLCFLSLIISAGISSLVDSSSLWAALFICCFTAPFSYFFSKFLGRFYHRMWLYCFGEILTIPSLQVFLATQLVFVNYISYKITNAIFVTLYRPLERIITSLRIYTVRFVCDKLAQHLRSYLSRFFSTFTQRVRDYCSDCVCSWKIWYQTRGKYYPRRCYDSVKNLWTGPSKFYLALALFITLCIIVMLYLNPFKNKKRQEKEKDQSFFSRKHDSMMKLGFFFASLVTAGDLRHWRSISPYLSMLNWVSDVFETDTGCSNHPRCLSNSSRYGEKLCSRCALRKAEEDVEMDRSTSAVTSPYTTFPKLVRDVVFGRDITWWKNSTPMFTRRIINSKDPRIVERFMSGLLTIRETNYTYFINSGISVPLDDQEVWFNYTCPQFSKQPLALFQRNGDSLINGEKLGFQNCPAPLELISKASLLFLSAPLGVTKMCFEYTEETCLVWWVLDREPDDIIMDKVKYTFIDSIYARYFPYRNAIYVVVAILCVALALYLNQERLEALSSYLSDKWQKFWKRERHGGRNELTKKTNVEAVFNSINERKEEASKNEGKTYKMSNDDANKRIREMTRVLQPAHYKGILVSEGLAAARDRQVVNDYVHPTERKQRERKDQDVDDDVVLELKAKPKTFWYYDINDWAKNVPTVGLEMYSESSSKTIRVKNSDEFQQAVNMGFKPKIVSSTYVTVSGDKFRADRANYNLAWKYVMWFASKPTSTLTPPEDLIPNILELSNGLNSRQHSLQVKRIALRSDGDVEPSGKEISDFNDYLRNSNTDAGTFTDAVFRNEANTNTLTQETCPFFFNGFQCPHGEGCEHPHDASDPMKVESIMYPMEHPVNLNCCYPIFVIKNGDYLPLANSVVTSGGFLTTRHTFFALNGLRLQHPIDMLRVYDHQSKKYYKITGLYDGAPDSFTKRKGEWDFCKFTVESELQMAAKENQLVCAPFNPSLGMCRMIQFNWRHMQPTLASSHSMGKLYNDCVLDYQGINTLPGDSGSAVIDMNGRLIALHKKGDPNSGLTFSYDGQLDPWFLSQSAAKNYLSPCVSL